MLKAILRQGAIVPLEPVPPDWAEGAQLEIDIAEAPSLTFDIDEWACTMETLCADSSANDEQVMRQAIERHREEAKDQARRLT